MTKLAAALPKGVGNGLDAIEAAMTEAPHEVHVVIALIDCKKVTTDSDTGEMEATARIRRIEAIEAGDKARAMAMMRRALESRTGATVLPFDLEQDVRAAFGSIDPDTGQILDD